MRFTGYLIASVLILLSVKMVNGQDTLTVVAYNLLKYANPNEGPDLRHYEFQKIAAYIESDIIVVQELHTSAGADSLLMVLNSMGQGNFQRAPQFYQFGGDTGNMLFYNADKLHFHSQNQINTEIREHSHYRLYMNDPLLSIHQDTTFMDVVGLHLKASTGSASTRQTQCTDLMNFLNALPDSSNIIVGGDFNFYANDSSEPGYGVLTDPAHSHTLNDIFPVWERNDAAYADLYTQSTRSFTYPGNNNGATGGNDDRFDFLFFNDNVINGTERVSYLANSYWAFGNDDYHFNKALIDPAVSTPTGTLNALVPDSIAQALFDMSDHLPVISRIKVDPVPMVAMAFPVKVFLEGAYDAANGAMTNHLRMADLLPLQQPYNQPPWNYAGTESYATTQDIPANAVDWLLIELRNAADSYQVLETKAVMLLQDGSVVDENGTAGVTFNSAVLNTPYFISVRHRNHLGVLASQTASLPTLTPHDFTVNGSVMGQSQLKEVEQGVFALNAGDFDGNGILAVDDFNFYKSQSAMLNQYVDSDANLDNTVSTTDFNLYLPNSSLIGVAQMRY